MDIKKERIERGLTQQEFAAILGVSRKTIVNYESGSKISLQKDNLFRKILNRYDGDKESVKIENLKKSTNVSINKILEKFKDIDDDEVVLYFDYKKVDFLKHPLLKSIIKSEAWRIVEQEMRNLIVENKLETPQK